MDAASGSPSATRAIIVSEIILIEDNNPPVCPALWTWETLCVSAVNFDDAEGMIWAEVCGAPANKGPSGNLGKKATS